MFVNNIGVDNKIFHKLCIFICLVGVIAFCCIGIDAYQKMKKIEQTVARQETLLMKTEK